MSQTPILGLDELDAAQTQPEIKVNSALRKLEALGQLRAFNQIADPPADPSDGDRYLVAAPASGDWAGHEDDLALYAGTSWLFLTPENGWLCWVDVMDGHLIFRNVASPGGWEPWP